MTKRNWFGSLHAALDSEGLLGQWSMFTNIGYDETKRHYINDKVIIIYRDERGFYERPIHYKTL